MAASAALKILLLGEDRSAGRTLRGVSDDTTRTTRTLRRMGAVATTAFAAAAVGAVKLGKAAAEDEAGATRLATALRNTAKATDAQIASTENWITAQGKALGVADDQLRPALGTLARATGDVGKAQELAALAMEVSAGTGKDLTTVATALARGYAGNVAGLKKLEVQTKNADGSTRTFAQITADLAKLNAGQAAKAAETNAGKQRRLEVAMSEAGETIGAKLLPYMLKATEAGLDMIAWAEKNGDVIKPLAIGLGALGAAVIALNGAARAATATMAAFNVVMNLNPVVATVTAVAALTTGLLLLGKSMNGARKEAKVSVGPWRDYMATLDGVTAATTASTRAAVLDRLEKAGLLETTRRLGLEDRTAVNAVLGSKAAREKLAVALRNTTKVTKEQEEALVRETGAIGRARLEQLRRNVALAENRTQLKKAQKALREFYKEPANKRVSIEGVEAARAQLDSLRRGLLQVFGAAKGTNGTTSGGLGALLLDPVLSDAKPKRANATGSVNYSGGLTMVGEAGRELVNLPRGSRIYSATQTRRILSGGSGDGGSSLVHIEFSGVVGDKVAVARQIVSTLKEAGFATGNLVSV